MRTVPTRAPASFGEKCSRTISAYAGTMPPWNRPNSPDTTYSDTTPSKGRNSSSATPCSTEPSSRVRRPPMRSEIQPESSRLSTPIPSITDSISAPRAAPNPRSLQ